MPLASPSPFRDALRRFPRANLPTALKSAEIQAQLAQEIQERSFFSAQTMLESVLDNYQRRLVDIISPRQERRADRVTPENPEGFVSVAPDAGSVRIEIRQLLKDGGHQTHPDKVGTIEDLSSDARINLVLDHNAAEARAYGHYVQSTDSDFADAWPCQELVRFHQRHEPRNWDAIWQSGCAQAGDEIAELVFRHTGRMAARKDSGVWLAISDFGHPWPPFKFGSGMGLRDLSRSESMDLGLIDRDTQIEIQRRAFNDQQEAA